MEEQIREFFAAHDALVQDLVLRVRELVLATVPGISEQLQRGYKMVMFGGGGRLKDELIYIDAMKDSVNLGFIHGVDLPDPQHKLRGSGKWNRFVKIRQPAELSDPALVALIKAAAEGGTNV